MRDFLLSAVKSVKWDIENGYYSIEHVVKKRSRSLAESVKDKRIAIIAELKPRSPSSGVLRNGVDEKLASELAKAGAAAISVLIERRHFGGSIKLLSRIAPKLRVPILFKDFLISTVQVDAARNAGADMVLLIAELFGKGFTEIKFEEMIDYAHSQGLEVLAETHDPSYLAMIESSNADYIGINNRDLATLSLNAEHFYAVSKNFGSNKFRVAESGYTSCAQILRDRKAGANAFLIGGALMASSSPASRLRELVNCG
jgi:indole-3-glycerol phosphate synthase